MDKLFTLTEFENSTTYSKLNQEVDNFLPYDLAGLDGLKTERLVEATLKLEESLKNIGTALSSNSQKRFNELLLKLKFFLLHCWSEKEIIDLIEKHFLFGWRLNIDIKGRLKIVLMSDPKYTQRDLFVKSLKEALRKNNEQFGRTEIAIKEAGKEKMVRPYLSNWLSDYEYALGVGKHNYLEITDYFFKNPNMRILTKEERAVLKNIFEFYESLKLTVTDPNGLSTYSLSFFGVKSVGSGLKQRFLPAREDTAKLYKKEKKMGMGIDFKTVQLITRESIKEGRSGAVKQMKELPSTPRAKTAPQTILQKTIKLEKGLGKAAIPLRPKKLEEGLSGPAIPQNSIVKLNSIDGLAQLSISDFRFFSQNPREAARFMFNKLRKLVMQGPAMRLQIQDSFKNSELYKLHLSQGKEIIDTGKTIGEITDLRRQQGREFMNEEEYRAVGAVGKAI